MAYVQQSTNTLFPVFLKLEHLRVLIVGGGKVGLEKITAVLANSPETEVVLVAPEINPEISSFAKKYPNVEIRRKEYDHLDLEGIRLVITATGKYEISEAIRVEARKRNLLVNVADTPDLCDFYLGSIVQKGDLKIAISTNGRSPTMAKRIKEILDEVFPDELQEVLRNLFIIRKRLKGNLEMKVRELNALTAVMVDTNKSESK